MKKILLLSVFMLTSLCCDFLRAGEAALNGQASVWSIFNGKRQAGIRYMPELRVSSPLAGERGLDAVMSLDASGWAPLDSPADFEENAEAELYRLWFRYSASQFEARLGLQKINFGQARILRSLMWFDSIDARDPLKFTDGVKALLGRYYFLNNANIWVWILSENRDKKGLEIFETDKDKMEYGGRYQFPFLKGEMAFSIHRRFIDAADWNSKMSVGLSDGPESRYACDGYWDIGPGLWFEGAVSEIRVTGAESFWNEFVTIGADYTFSIGPGIHMLYEHFIKSADEVDVKRELSALSIDFNISVFDNLNAIVYYDWEENKTYSFLGLRRAYDNWMVSLNFFSGREDDGGIYGGQGIQCILVYNH